MATREFPEWLQEQLNNREWSQADLSRKTKLSTAAISRIMSGFRRPDPDSIVKIAKALKLPPETVYRAAGMLPLGRQGDPSTLEEIEHKFALLSEEAQQQALDYLNFLLEKQEREARSAQDRKGLAPTER